MLKSLVIYYSKTGNTKKVAEAIAKGLKTKAKKVEEVKNLKNYDLICVGTPVYAMAPAKTVKEFLKKIPTLKNKKGAAFCTMAFVGADKIINYIKKEMEKKGIKFLGGFSCKGRSGIIAGKGPKVWNIGRPNKEDLKKAENFGKNLTKKW